MKNSLTITQVSKEGIKELEVTPILFGNIVIYKEKKDETIPL